MMILQMDQTLHIRPLSVEFDHTLRLKGDRRGGTVTFELFGRDQEGVEHRLVLLPQKVEASQEDPQSASADGLVRIAKERMQGHLKQLREDLD